MAKKKETAYPVMVGAMSEYQPPPVSDNNPDGPSNLPDDRLNGTMYPEGKFDFVGLVAEGESPFKPDVNTATANGISKSRGQGHNCQYNWWKGNSGRWNKNDGWDGGNMTGQ